NNVVINLNIAYAVVVVVIYNLIRHKTQQSTSGIVGRTTCIKKLSQCLGLPRVAGKPTPTRREVSVRHKLSQLSTNN
ncbi:MAG: hypothetical protein AAFW70_23495, partial [Cyanobacteria bacterium J06635_10]